MYCPNCQTLCGDTNNFCRLCGAPLRMPKPKKGSRRVPLFILIIMSVAGLIAFFATTGNSAPVHAQGSFIPESVNVLGQKSFYGCTSLEAVSISGQVRIIREDAFDNCSNLSYIFYDGTYAGWSELYDEFINPDVGVFCRDGSFYQGGEQ